MIVIITIIIIMIIRQIYFSYSKKNYNRRVIAKKTIIDAMSQEEKMSSTCYMMYI